MNTLRQELFSDISAAKREIFLVLLSSVVVFLLSLSDVLTTVPATQDRNSMSIFVLTGILSSSPRGGGCIQFVFY